MESKKLGFLNCLKIEAREGVAFELFRKAVDVVHTVETILQAFPGGREGLESPEARMSLILRLGCVDYSVEVGGPRDEIGKALFREGPEDQAKAKATTTTTKDSTARTNRRKKEKNQKQRRDNRGRAGVCRDLRRSQGPGPDHDVSHSTPSPVADQA